MAGLQEAQQLLFVGIGQHILGTGFQRRIHELALVGAGRKQQQAAMLEHERHRTIGAQIAAVFAEGMTHIGHGAGFVVGEAIDHHRRASEAIALATNLLVGHALKLPRPAWMTEDLILLEDQVRRFVSAEYVPHLERWHDEHMYPREVWTKAGAAGLLCASMPEEYGGAGMDNVCYAIAMEEIARACESVMLKMSSRIGCGAMPTSRGRSTSQLMALPMKSRLMEWSMTRLSRKSESPTTTMRVEPPSTLRRPPRSMATATGMAPRRSRRGSKRAPGR